MDEIILKELIQSARDRINDLDRILADIQKLRTKISEAVHAAEREADYFDKRSELISSLDKIYAQLITVADSIYYRFFSPNTFNGLLYPTEANRDFVLNIVSKTDGIDLFSADGIGYIRMKMLPLYSDRSSISGRRSGGYYNKKLGEGLEFLLCEQLEKKAFQVKFGRRMLMHYLFVYPTSKPTNQVPDSTNHDIRNVQDAIAVNLFGSDAWDTCNAYFTTVTTDEIPEGTYITVCRDDENVPKFFEIIERWRAHFEGDSDLKI